MKINDDFVNYIDLLSLAIAVVNYRENLQQSNADDVIQQLNASTHSLLSKLEDDLQYQNKMLKTILAELKEMQI